MKWFFDTSVLVSVFYANHAHHVASSELFLRARKDDFCALHTLGEVYATLTGLPVRPRISGADSIKIVKQIRERLTVVSLTEPEYLATLESNSSTITGGAIYDAFIAQCAAKIDAEVLLTWNIRDFRRFGPQIARILKTPLEL